MMGCVTHTWLQIGPLGPQKILKTPMEGGLTGDGFLIGVVPIGPAVQIRLRLKVSAGALAVLRPPSLQRNSFCFCFLKQLL